MAKIALIGAGSVVFAKNLIGDILGFPELASCHIALMDIVTEQMAHKVAAALHATCRASAPQTEEPPGIHPAALPESKGQINE